MKKIYTLILVCFFGFINNAQVVNIPDAAFKAKLLAANTGNLIAYNSAGNAITIDVNSNGQIEANELLNVASLNVSNYTANPGNIVSISGIQSFINLKYLGVHNNQIANVDLSGMNLLIEVDFSRNQLSNINTLTSSNLTHLNVSDNQIAGINLSPFSHLSNLVCSGNPIAAINLNGHPSLAYLEIESTSVSTLDCSLTGITNLYCSDNENLTSINVQNGQYSYSDPDLLFFAFRFENLPLLTSICVDNGEQNNLAYTNYNSGGNAVIYTGPTCSTVILGIAEMAIARNIDVYPNPVNDQIHFDYDGLDSVAIYNMLGQLVKSYEAIDATGLPAIDVSELKSGNYILNARGEGRSLNAKFIKR